MTGGAILAAVEDAVADSACTTLCSDAPVADLLAAIRAATSECVLLIFLPEASALDRAMLLAAIGPLAVERAPAHRICALDIKAGASEADIVAAARFLAHAASTTGQVLALS
jgi:hypothetical protein